MQKTLTMETNNGEYTYMTDMIAKEHTGSTRGEQMVSNPIIVNAKLKEEGGYEDSFIKIETSLEPLVLNDVTSDDLIRMHNDGFRVKLTRFQQIPPRPHRGTRF